MYWLLKQCKISEEEVLTNKPNYNKLGIEFHNCRVCKKQTEQVKVSNNVRKCLVCDNIQLGNVKI